MEIQRILPPGIELISLDAIGCKDELPETKHTIAGNSLQKAEFVYDHYKRDCFAEDSGLEIEALHGAPGVNSAHYSGTRDADANNRLVLEQLKGQLNRRARFLTVITLIKGGTPYQFSGIVTGHITESPRGTLGFGYDPLFVPDGVNKTFAEMAPGEKVNISHRTKAFDLMTKCLEENF